MQKMRKGMPQVAKSASKVAKKGPRWPHFGPDLENWLGQIGRNVVLGKIYGLGGPCGGLKLEV